MFFLQRAVLLALSVFFVAAPVNATELPAPSWLSGKLAEAQQDALWEQPHWHKLLHYRVVRGGVESMAEGARLFISSRGAHDPKAELLATIKALAINAYLPQRDELALCAFPARYRWLKAQLELSNQDFPTFHCEQRERWRQELNPTSATLVFPDAYISSPGSMFGHTLLRVNGAKQGAKAGLLAYAINYAADVRGVGAVEYAVKGIMGGFPGFFGVFPYYTKVKEYAWIEHRDIWEYPLNLTELELTRMLEHVWELKLVPFRYFFFNRNCSWQLLALLDVAKPGLNLTEGFDAYAIPVDTVRRLQELNLITRAPELRPSRQRAVDATEKNLSPEAKRWVSKLVSGEGTVDSPGFANVPERTKIKVLDTAYELIHSRFRRGVYTREQALPRAYALLKARSQLGTSDESATMFPEVVSPDKAHPSARWGLSYGDGAFGTWLGAGIRPAFHDLLDPAPGFLPGYAINFAQFDLRYYLEEERLRLQSVTVLEATSRNVWTSWSRPLSWRLSFGLQRPAWLLPADADPDLGFNLRAEGGISAGSSRRHLFVGAALDGHWGEVLNKAGRLAAGPRLAARAAVAEHTNVELDYEWLWNVAGVDLNSNGLHLGIHQQISANNGLRFKASRIELDGRYTSSPTAEQEFSLTWLHYF